MKNYGFHLKGFPLNLVLNSWTANSFRWIPRMNSLMEYSCHPNLRMNFWKVCSCRSIGLERCCCVQAANSCWSAKVVATSRYLTSKVERVSCSGELSSFRSTSTGLAFDK
jgi:hypothetical protein